MSHLRRPPTTVMMGPPQCRLPGRAVTSQGSKGPLLHPEISDDADLRALSGPRFGDLANCELVPDPRGPGLALDMNGTGPSAGNTARLFEQSEEAPRVRRLLAGDGPAYGYYGWEGRHLQDRDPRPSAGGRGQREDEVKVWIPEEVVREGFQALPEWLNAHSSSQRVVYYGPGPQPQQRAQQQPYSASDVGRFRAYSPEAYFRDQIISYRDWQLLISHHLQMIETRVEQVDYDVRRRRQELQDLKDMLQAKQDKLDAEIAALEKQIKESKRARSGDR